MGNTGWFPLGPGHLAHRASSGLGVYEKAYFFGASPMPPIVEIQVFAYSP